MVVFYSKVLYFWVNAFKTFNHQELNYYLNRDGVKLWDNLIEF